MVIPSLQLTQMSRKGQASPSSEAPSLQRPFFVLFLPSERKSFGSKHTEFWHGFCSQSPLTAKGPQVKRSPREDPGTWLVEFLDTRATSWQMESTCSCITQALAFLWGVVDEQYPLLPVCSDRTEEAEALDKSDLGIRQPGSYSVKRSSLQGF